MKLTFYSHPATILKLYYILLAQFLIRHSEINNPVLDGCIMYGKLLNTSLYKGLIFSFCMISKYYDTIYHDSIL